MKLRFFYSLLCCLMASISLQAQELNATVTVMANNVSKTDPRAFKVLETSLREFINSRKWTDDSFRPDERLQCSFLITITEELSANQFRGQLTVQASRPVYNASYKTTMVNYQDKNFQFEYTEGLPIDFNENSYTNELTAVIAYYVYVVLGTDYDSFAQSGGNPYFAKAQQIVNVAQSNSADKSWQPQGNTNNRYWLVENLMRQKFKNYREATYSYHRLGLDQMYSDPNAARKAMANAIAMVEKIRSDNPTNMLGQWFINAKSDEIISAFADKQVPPTDKMKVYNAMILLDAANKPSYDKINASTSNSSPANMLNDARQNGMMEDNMFGKGK